MKRTVKRGAIIAGNTKAKSKYEIRPNTFLYLATNQPVRITDSKSGIIRRLIDVSPSGNKVPIREYNKLVLVRGLYPGLRG